MKILFIGYWMLNYSRGGDSGNEEDGKSGEGDRSGYDESDADDNRGGSNEKAKYIFKQIYTKQQYKSKSNKELVSICKNYGIISTGTKYVLVSRLLKAQKVTKESATECLRNLQKCSSKLNASPHNYYRESFNSVDLLDRYYYRLQHSHRINTWESKFISLLEIGLINSYSPYSSITDIDFFNFKNEVADLLLA